MLEGKAMWNRTLTLELREIFATCGVEKTPKQMNDLLLFWLRNKTPEAIIARAYAPAGYNTYVGVPDWCGMFIGIESDGYTHS